MRRVQTFFVKHRETIGLISGLALYCALSYFAGLPCPIRYVTGLSCPGCGMTRSLFALLRLDFSGALYYHPFIYPALILIPCFAVFSAKGMKRAKAVTGGVIIALLTAIYLWRILVLHSPVVELHPEEGALIGLFFKFFR